MRDDADTAADHDRDDRLGHRHHTLSAVFVVSIRQTDAEICTVSGQGVACRGIRPVGHLLSAQCQRAQRTIWHPGITVYRPGRLFAPMETADVIIDCWRDDILHDPCANFVLTDKNMENIDDF